MKNVPSKEEFIGYLKNGKRTILSTIAIVGLLYAMFYSYSIYTAYKETVDEELFLSQDEIVEIIEKEPEEVSTLELREVEEALEQERYSFGVLIERVDQSLYNYPNLIREFLISEEVVSNIEDRIGKEILPTPELAVNVTEDSQTRIQYVSIGSGDEEDNVLIAQAYFEIFQEGNLIQPLEDKIVYMMDNEPFLIEEETWMEMVMSQFQLFDPLTAIIGIIVALIIGFVVGIIIVLIKTIFQKEIPFLYSLEVSNSDKVIYMNQLKGLNEHETNKKIAHTVLAFSEKRKLILTETSINEELKKVLNASINKSGLSSSYSIVNSLEDSHLTDSYDEVIIMVEQNSTTKDWYKNQRLLLERLDIPVIIINY